MVRAPERVDGRSVLSVVGCVVCGLFAGDLLGLSVLKVIVKIIEQASRSRLSWNPATMYLVHCLRASVTQRGSCLSMEDMLKTERERASSCQSGVSKLNDVMMIDDDDVSSCNNLISL